MKVLYSNIIILVLIITVHFIIIIQNGQNYFVFDIILILGILGMLALNIYSIITLIKKVNLPIVIALTLSFVYYLLLYVFPIFAGTR
jgi:hypothetical protein